VDRRRQQSRRETKPQTDQAAAGTDRGRGKASAAGEYALFCEGDVPLLFTENETNHERLFPGQKNDSPYVKDGINDCVVQGKQDAVNPGKQGHQGRGALPVEGRPGQSATVRLRLTGPAGTGKSGKTQIPPSCFGPEFENTLSVRLQEADAFYRS